jgi:hypothetical protein
MEVLNEGELADAIRILLKRSLTDPNFRTRILVDGNGEVETLTGKSLPAGVTLRFVDNHGKSNKTLSLPDPLPEADQLSESDLEQVAGGCCLVSCVQSE